jgi:hypothetical protein
VDAGIQTLARARNSLVRIQPLHYKTACFPLKNEGSGTTLATHSRDSLKCFWGPRQRTRRRFLQGQHLQEWTGIDRQASQSNWPEMRKTLRKPGFTSGEQEPNFRVFSKSFGSVRKIPRISLKRRNSLQATIKQRLGPAIVWLTTRC